VMFVWVVFVSVCVVCGVCVGVLFCVEDEKLGKWKNWENGKIGKKMKKKWKKREKIGKKKIEKKNWGGNFFLFFSLSKLTRIFPPTL